MQKKYNIDEVVPHSSPMILIDEILEYSDQHLISRVDITSSSLFLTNQNYVPTWVGIEYMAQSVAAWSGIQSRQKSQPIKMGYLIGCKQYEVSRDGFYPGERLIISVVKKYLGNGIGLSDSRIEIDSNIIVKSLLTVFQP